MTPANAAFKAWRTGHGYTRRHLVDGIRSQLGEAPSQQAAAAWDSSSRPSREYAIAMDAHFETGGVVTAMFGYLTTDDPLGDIARRLDDLLALVRGQGALLFVLAQSELDLSEQELANLLQEAGVPPPP